MTRTDGRVVRAVVSVLAPLSLGAAAEALARVGGLAPAGASAVFAAAVVVGVTALRLAWRRVLTGGPLTSPVSAGHGLGLALAAGVARAFPFVVIVPGSFGTPTGRSVAVAVALVLGSVVAEEVQFRGLVLDVIGRGWSWTAGVTVSTAVFTALHVVAVPPLLLVTVAADAVVFCALRRSSGLTGAVVAHAVFDVATVVFVPREVSPLTQVAYVGCAVAVDVVVVALARRRAAEAGGGARTTSGRVLTGVAP